ncbi:DNA-binding transcriptional regulator, XRE-family HTH domain [Fibrobacter sp. UWH9]|uniref:helix-turn-helix domain-containing protein n=1 Tax=unclassified Fibrobacter TaxID=2634177 RepID=UPI00090F2038|nr:MULTISPECIES: helix-turn-helix transcriptional regulator [unclassified Fibrobacter]MCQ2100078.1 helix-turn-helix domain-containing protein [Fibrobacter sp.]SHH31560.1 DNA-binding transcriptional regulator, XRE-family HTH domain [Fibrobacter sp. UWH9]SHL68722.1 DNA-binding transcriptional regulator, XRE-family HTH domain [Fibrobacter sp. UWH6]
MVKYTPFSDEAVLVEFGKRIAGYRLNNNWTQAELANRAGVSKSTVEHIEKGQSTQLLNMVKILRALGLLNQFISIVPELGPSPMELLMQSKNQQKNKRKRASKPRNNTQRQASSFDSPNDFSETSIAAESKSKWVWDEDK